MAFWKTTAEHLGKAAIAAGTYWSSLASPSCRVTNLERKQEEDVSIFAPIAPFRIVRPNEHMEICFDTRTRNPVYVQHRIVVDESKGTKPRHRFKEETLIEEPYRSKNSHYHLTGFDRGHMAPAADFINEEDTYSLCNVSPQNQDMNRKIWAFLEDLTRQIARQSYRENEAVTYVTTGPLWMPSGQFAEKVFRYNLLGIGKPPSLVMVPTHFFKVVVVLNKEETKILKFACFVVPNNATANDRTLDEYAVGWSDLEIVTGLRFYPALVDEEFRAKADAITHRALPKDKKPLLLTDGSKTPNYNPRKIQELQHLCENQGCRMKKQR
jgi:DNA/RNA endonuclease G (NUC1)